MNTSINKKTNTNNKKLSKLNEEEISEGQKEGFKKTNFDTEGTQFKLSFFNLSNINKFNKKRLGNCGCVESFALR